jgi:hypothetical protein
MIYSLEDLKTLVKPIAEEYGIEMVYLFGSYARGDADDKSDVDLLIRGFSSNKPWAYPRMFVDMEEAISKKVDIVSVEALNATPNDTRYIKRFKYNLKKERVLIYEKQ